MDHTRETIHPYVCEDLQSAKIVTFYTWTDAVLGLPFTSLLARAREIAQSSWFEDRIFQDALMDYCRATTEKTRYDPFVHLTNRIIERARGKLSGVGKTYPINDFCIANNSDRVVKCIPEHAHGSLGAKRRPDLLGLSSTKAVNLYRPGGSVHWLDILVWGEVKHLNLLIEDLDKERGQRGMTALDDSGFPIDRPKPGRKKIGNRTGLFANKSTESRGRKRATRPRAVEVEVNTTRDAPPVRVGRKRLARDDLLAGLGIGSSAKRRNSRGTTNDLVVGGDAAVQSGSYALELLSCTYGTRVHCFSFVLKDDKMTLWYYDASGVLYTTEYISLVADFEVFAAVIIGFACCDPEDFGVMPSSIMKPSSRSLRSRFFDTLGDRKLSIKRPGSERPMAVTLDKPLFAQYALTGRRSFLYTIKTTPAASSKDLIIKFSYQVCTRRAEQDLVSIARKAGVKHLPRIHGWAELWNLSDGVRQIFYRKSKGKAKYEDRTLRAIIYTQYSSIRELFTHSCELIPVMVDQMIDCLHDLRYKANMLHRDISVSNIMYQIRGGLYHFILIDFDMAVVLPQDGESSYHASSNHRTGTLPFMAYELIYNASRSRKKKWKPIPHLLRHDYESLFWLALWCVLTLLTNGLDEVDAEDLLTIAKRLERGELGQIAGYKAILSMTTLDDSNIDLPPAARRLTKWFTAWNIILIRSVSIVQMWKALHGPDIDDSADDVHVVAPEDAWLDAGKDDWETAGGTYTRDRLKAALSRAFPMPGGSNEPEQESEDSDLDVDDDGKVPHPKRAQKDHPVSQDTDVTKPRRSIRNKKTGPAKPVAPQPEENNI